MKASDLIGWIVEVEHPNHLGCLWLVTSSTEEPRRLRLHHNGMGGWWAYLLDVDGDDITLSIYDDMGQERILCGEIVNRPTVSEVAQ